MQFRYIADRQITAGITVAVLAIGIPLLFGLVLLVVSGWVLAFGGHPHREVWGWLSDTSTRDSQGRVIWDVGEVPIFYWFGILNVYVVYQVVEIVYAGFRAFQKALA